MAPMERFKVRVEVDHATGCHIWRGAKSAKGYGRFSISGRLVQTHRFAYEATRGAIRGGLQLDHLCRNRDHLEPVEPGENVRRGYAARERGIARCPKGHAFTAENTYPKPGRRPGTFYRECRECRRVRAIRQAEARRSPGTLT